MVELLDFGAGAFKLEFDFFTGFLGADGLFGNGRADLGFTLLDLQLGEADLELAFAKGECIKLVLLGLLGGVGLGVRLGAGLVGLRLGGLLLGFWRACSA